MGYFLTGKLGRAWVVHGGGGDGVGGVNDVLVLVGGGGGLVSLNLIITQQFKVFKIELGLLHMTILSVQKRAGSIF